MNLPKITQSELDDIFELQQSMQKKNRQLRQGQAFFNALYELNPTLADSIRSTELDPFFDSTNKKISILVSKITE